MAVKDADRLAWLNSLLPFHAEAELLKCCGSRRWARRLAERRPFRDLPSLFSAADATWKRLAADDWLEAFAAHPRIGHQRLSAGWAAEEQAGTREASSQMLGALASANEAYKAKFGHIFIVCATGKSAGEMLALLEARMQNDAATELRTAAEEQRKITRLRLERLVADPEPRTPDPDDLDPCS